jgi:hypothetical protein
MAEGHGPGRYAPSAADYGALIHQFSAKFGLTAAETRVLGEIIAGHGLLAAAARLNITEATARPTRSTFSRKPEPNAKQNSFAASSRSPSSARPWASEFRKK